MKYCDLTIAYNETSGGIRTYLDQKRRFIAEKTSHEHILIVPGEGDHCEQEGRLTKITLASPLIPGCEPYRFFWKPERIRAELERVRPDVVELGSFFVCPAAAFRYREEAARQGRDCHACAYFHTDVADAYIGSPLRQWLSNPAEGFSDTLAHWGEQLSELAASKAQSYFGSIFKRCDLTFAANETQAARLAEYGVNDTLIIPLGVDTEVFHPRRRSDCVRHQYKAEKDTLLLVYAGRLDSEKQVEMLVDAYEKLDADHFRLLMAGDGPLRKTLQLRADALEGFTLLPYLSNREALAELLASCDIYITAGPHETFGLSVVEAMSAGLPVVGVDAGALPDRVQVGHGRLGAVGDAQAMAVNIQEIAREQERYSAAARAHVENAGYDWSSTFRRLLDVVSSQ